MALLGQRMRKVQRLVSVSTIKPSVSAASFLLPQRVGGQRKLSFPRITFKGIILRSLRKMLLSCKRYTVTAVSAS